MVDRWHHLILLSLEVLLKLSPLFPWWHECKLNWPLQPPRPFGACREIHPLDPQTIRYCMLASTASAPRVTRCSLGLYWSRDLCSKHALAGSGDVILSRSQRNLMIHDQCPLPVYFSQVPGNRNTCQKNYIWQPRNLGYQSRSATLLWPRGRSRNLGY